MGIPEGEIYTTGPATANREPEALVGGCESLLKGHRILFFLLVLLLLCLLPTAGCTLELEKDSPLTGEKSLADLPAAGEGMLLLHFY
jgi:hypothetical protein